MLRCGSYLSAHPREFVSARIRSVFSGHDPKLHPCINTESRKNTRLSPGAASGKKKAIRPGALSPSTWPSWIKQFRVRLFVVQGIGSLATVWRRYGTAPPRGIEWRGLLGSGARMREPQGDWTVREPLRCWQEAVKQSVGQRCCGNVGLNVRPLRQSSRSCRQTRRVRKRGKKQRHI